MLTFTLKENPGIVAYDSCRPKNDYESGVQKIDSETNLPLWIVGTIFRQEGALRSEMVSVTVPSAKDPSELFKPFDRVMFDDLCVMTGDNNGNTWVSLRAAKVVPAGAAQNRSESK